MNKSLEMIDFNIIYKTIEKYIQQQNEKDQDVLYALSETSIFLYRKNILNFYYVLDEKHNYHKVEKIDKTDIVPQQPMPFLQTEWDVIYTVLEYYTNENPEAHDRDRVLNSLVDLSGFMFGKNIVPYCYCYSENDPWGYTIKGYDD